MRHVDLYSEPSSADGVFSQWVSDSGFKCVTVERPDLNNTPNISCIPRGKTYLCRWGLSPKHGWCFYIMDVPGRTDCEIHSANFDFQLEGCIAPGWETTVFRKGFVYSKGKPALDRDTRGVTFSKAALQKLQEDLGTEDFLLTIH